MQEHIRTAGNTESPGISLGLLAQGGGGSSGGNSGNLQGGTQSPQ